MTTKAKGKEITLSPMTGITVSEIVGLANGVGGLKNSGLTSEVFLKYLKFKNEIDAVTKKHGEDVKVLMEGYNVKIIFNPLLNQSTWDYEKHPKKAEIKEKLDGINDAPYELKNSHFIPDSQLFEVTKKMDLNQVAFISKYLMVQ